MKLHPSINSFFRTAAFAFSAWVFSTSLLQAQVTFATNAPNQGLAGITGPISNEFSVFHNPATLSFLDNKSLALGAINRFSVAELSIFSLAAQQRLKRAGVGIGVRSFNFSEYANNQVTLGYGLQLADKISAGVSLNYQHLKIGESQETLHTLASSAGFVVKATQDFTFSTHFSQIGWSKNTNQRLNSWPTAELGFAYQLGSNFNLFGAFEKKQGFSPTYKFAGLYTLHPQFSLRYGILIDTYLHNTFGIQYEYKMLLSHLSGQVHPILGLSTAFSIAFLIQNSDAE